MEIGLILKEVTIYRKILFLIREIVSLNYNVVQRISLPNFSFVDLPGRELPVADVSRIQLADKKRKTVAVAVAAI